MTGVTPQLRAAAAAKKRRTKKYPDSSPLTAKKVGDRRPGSLKANMPAAVARSAAQNRRGALKFKRAGQGAHVESPARAPGDE